MDLLCDLATTVMHPEEQIGQICVPSGGNTAFLVSHDHFYLSYPLKRCRLCVKGQRGCFACVLLQVHATVSCVVLLI